MKPAGQRGAGPLAGLRILEIAAIGPGPFCAMMLADMGAQVTRIDRVSGGAPFPGADARRDVAARGRESLALDLKNPQGVQTVLRLCRAADGLIEGFRPGVMERLGLGPDVCMAANPRLVYGRMTGWGQSGPLARHAGHDINYLAISGMLYLFGRGQERPSPPLNLVADMGGGGLLLAFGMTCALIERAHSGRGQVVDAAMVEGAALLATSVFTLQALGQWREERGSNLLDSGAPFYEVYATRDGGYMAVGAIEPQFYAQLLAGLGLDAETLPAQMERAAWPATKRRFADIFRTRTRSEWTEHFAARDACVTPVLTPLEAVRHPHALARGSFHHACGALHPAAAPRFSRSAPALAAAPPLPGEHSEHVLRSFGFSVEQITKLRECGAMAGPEPAA
jgi:alpha-methylacyl-CoA racemase